MTEYSPRQITRDSWDSGDLYASVMSNWFAVCDYLTDLDEPIPASWQFRRSPFGSDTDSYEYQNLQELEVSADDALRLGNVLARFSSILHAAGKSY